MNLSKRDAGSEEINLYRRPDSPPATDPDFIKEVVEKRWKLAEELSGRFLAMAIEAAQAEGVRINPVATVDVWIAKTVLASDKREWHISTLKFGLAALIRDRVDRRLNDLEIIRQAEDFHQLVSDFWQKNIEFFADWQRTCAMYGLDLRAKAVRDDRR